jgi:hypothetical protein
MLGRYLSAAVVGVLISAWLASIAYSVFYLRNAQALAIGVERDTVTYQEVFDEANQVRLGALQFPRGSVFAAVKKAWGEGGPPRPYPGGLIAPPATASAITRPADTAAPRRAIGPRR